MTQDTENTFSSGTDKAVLLERANDELSSKLLKCEQKCFLLENQLKAFQPAFYVNSVDVALYYDTGSGFDGDHVLTQTILSGEGESRATFTLPEEALALSIYIGCLPCFIENIRFNIPALVPSSNGIKLSDNSYLFKSPTPNFYFSDTRGFLRDSEISFDFTYTRLNFDCHESFLNAIFGHLEKASSLIDQKDAVEALTVRNSVLLADLNKMKNSRCWKLTAPIRKLSDSLRHVHES